MMIQPVKVEEIEVFGWKAALRGMRNPLNSWYRQDSIVEDGELKFLGENDRKLMLNLTKAGSEHRKFLRMIHVQMDITLPRYVWSEFDTYHFHVSNSCSTMHKLLTKDFITKDMFSYDEESADTYGTIIKDLNEFRKEYIKPETGAVRKRQILRAAKMLLPEGYLQKRTIDTNYEELLTIFKQRQNHRLPEWQEFCDKLLELPLFRMLAEELSLI